MLHYLPPLLLDPASDQHFLDPWNLEPSHLGGEGEEPAHETQLGRVVHGGGHLKPGLHLVFAVFLQQDQVLKAKTITITFGNFDLYLVVDAVHVWIGLILVCLALYV